MTDRSAPSVIIFGAGLAGLAAAYTLSRQGCPVTLLDYPGWRQDSPAHSAEAPAMFLGSHHHTRRLLRDLEGHRLTTQAVLLPLEFRLPDGPHVSYRPARLPGPLQWIVGLTRFPGLTWNDRWTLFSYLEQVWEGAESLPSDLDSRSADDWLASVGQSQAARSHIWNPLARWLTGNQITRLSAAVFVQVLSTSFLGRASDARLSYLQGSLEDRLLSPLRTAVNRCGATLLLQTERPDLRFEQLRLDGIRLADGTLLKAHWYLAALPHQALLSLLPERLLTRYAYFAHISELALLPELTLQVTCRPIVGKPRLLLSAASAFHQLTLTGHGPHQCRCRMSAIADPFLASYRDDQIIELGKSALHSLLPEIGADGIHAIELYRENHAVLSLRPGTALLRPIQKSPVPNLLLAGNWTDTGQPANVESTLISAQRCVDVINHAPV